MQWWRFSVCTVLYAVCAVLEQHRGLHRYLDRKLVVENDGAHGMEEKTGRATLSQGEHNIVITYYESPFWICPNKSNSYNVISDMRCKEFLLYCGLVSVVLRSAYTCRDTPAAPRSGGGEGLKVSVTRMVNATADPICFAPIIREF